MDEIIAGILKFSPIIGGIVVPTVGVWLKVRNDRQDPAAVRALKQHVKLLESMPKSTRGPIADLISFEASKYASERIRKAQRTINWGGLFALLFVAFIVGVVIAVLIAWGMFWWPGFLSLPPALIVAAAAITAGSQQVFTYGDAPGAAPAPAPAQAATSADPEPAPVSAASS